MKAMTRSEIFAELKSTLIEQFEVEPMAVRPEARLFEDLELDSIDAIDMAVKVQSMTGERVEERTLRALRTVGDLVELIERTLVEKAA